MGSKWIRGPVPTSSGSASIPSLPAAASSPKAASSPWAATAQPWSPADSSFFVLHDIFRSGVSDPPPGTDTTPVPSKPGLTKRSVALERIASADCGKCHSKFEPLAFGLEKFDGLGTFRESDEFGNRLREDGEVLFPGTPEPVPYQTASELMDLLAASDHARESITWKVAQSPLGRPLGRPLVASDEPILRQIHRST